MLIYFTENLKNGMSYIGKDSAENPNYFGSGTIFVPAFKKLGKINFKKHILISGINNKNELNLWERFYTDLFGVVEDPLFYNIVPGGEGFANKNIYQFDKSGNFIKEYHSLESALQIIYGQSKGNLSSAASGTRNYYKGFRWSFTLIPNDLKPTLKSGRKKGTKNSYKIKRKHVNTITTQVKCFENGILIKTFQNQLEGANYFNISKEHFNQIVISSSKGKLYKKKYFLERSERIRKTIKIK